ncbi:MAG TPA: KilA-N domain-containing protein [Nitrosarchaeum sp.]|nr:KilA-N domain-containing protein [Nitrosarchaeum sp.]
MSCKEIEDKFQKLDVKYFDEKKYVKGKYKDLDVVIMKKNGYINISQLCKIKKKAFKHWMENNRSKELLNEFSETHNKKSIIKIIGGKNTKVRGTYMHPLLVPKILEWASAPKNKTVEKQIQEKLAKKLSGKIEVQTEFGCIDILTETELIEVKKFKNWKSAVGQVIIYGEEYPNHIKHIYLFGCENQTQIELKKIRNVLKKHNIKLTCRK